MPMLGVCDIIAEVSLHMLSQFAKRRNDLGVKLQIASRRAPVWLPHVLATFLPHVVDCETRVH